MQFDIFDFLESNTVLYTPKRKRYISYYERNKKEIYKRERALLLQKKTYIKWLRSYERLFESDI